MTYVYRPLRIHKISMFIDIGNEAKRKRAFDCISELRRIALLLKGTKKIGNFKFQS